MTNGKTSLSDAIGENIALLSAMGIFATIAAYFLSQIDTSEALISTFGDYLLWSASFFSNLIFILMAFEFHQNIRLFKDKSFRLRLFYHLSLLFIASVEIMFAIIYKEYIISFLPWITPIIGGIIIAYIVNVPYKELIKYIERYKTINKYIEQLGYYVSAIICALIFYRYFLQPINNTIIKLIEMIPK